MSLVNALHAYSLFTFDKFVLGRPILLFVHKIRRRREKNESEGEWQRRGQTKIKDKKKRRRRMKKRRRRGKSIKWWEQEYGEEREFN